MELASTSGRLCLKNILKTVTKWAADAETWTLVRAEFGLLSRFWGATGIGKSSVRGRMCPLDALEDGTLVPAGTDQAVFGLKSYRSGDKNN